MKGMICLGRTASVGDIRNNCVQNFSQQNWTEGTTINKRLQDSNDTGIERQYYGEQCPLRS